MTIDRGSQSGTAARALDPPAPRQPRLVVVAQRPTMANSGLCESQGECESGEACEEAENSVRAANGRGAGPENEATDLIGSTVGRFVIVGLLGHGSMGVVYRAYDLVLGREVAIKLLQSERLGNGIEGRLVREARVMAKVSHPNVVAVHEVIVEDERVILAMEYVAGRTLSEWLRRGRRSWPQILDVFVAAGHGLAAAHQVGVVHRDFKPANVLVAEAPAVEERHPRRTVSSWLQSTPAALVNPTQVKVTDFGIATGLGQLRQMHEHGVVVPGDDVRLTHAHALFGTPWYMAPEQHAMQGVDPRTDQYSFCLALWEGLCASSPFDGATIFQLEAKKRNGPPPWPREVRVPRQIAEAIRRGLSPRPEERFDSMRDLLEAIAYDPSQRRRRAITLWMGAAAVLGTGSATWQAAVATSERPCSGADSHLVGVWDAARRSEVEAAMQKIDAQYAALAQKRTTDELDRYAAAWKSMHSEACEATAVRGEQSPEIMDLRMACLHRAKMTFGAVTGVFVAADAEVVENAAQVLSELRPLARCADVEALQADVEPPLPAEAEAVAEIQTLLAESTAEKEAGHYVVAAEKAAEAKARAVDLEYGPLQTEVALVEGQVLEQLGRYDSAEWSLRRALGLAHKWSQRDALQQAASQLMFVVGVHRRRMDEGLRYREFAEPITSEDPYHEALFHNRLGAVLAFRDNYDEAERELRRAVVVMEHAALDSHVGVFRNDLGVLLQFQDKHEEAVVAFRRALTILETSLGPDHPSVAMVRHNLGESLHRLGIRDEAERELRRALALLEKLGPHHPRVAEARTNLADALLANGKIDEAIPLAEAAWSERQLDAPEEYRAATAFVLAQALWVSSEAETVRKRARGLAEQALSDYEKAGVQREENARQVRTWLAERPL